MQNTCFYEALSKIVGKYAASLIKAKHVQYSSSVFISKSSSIRVAYNIGAYEFLTGLCKDLKRLKALKGFFRHLF